jgi:hypothetical protein
MLHDRSELAIQASNHQQSTNQGRMRLAAFLVTVDAECDNAWARKKDVSTKNAGFLPRFQTLCESFGLKPTYFTNYEMAKSPAFQQFGRDILERGTGEIAMHLHAWDSPPIVPLTENDALYHPYVTQYPESIMRDKIAFMTDLLEDTFGVKITSHRAGRWGFNEAYARMLVERGYLADCSVTPLHSWANHLGDPRRGGGPDYTHFPLSPYFLDPNDIRRPGRSPLLEIPVTAMELRSPVLRSLEVRLADRPVLSWALNRVFPQRCLLLPDGHNGRLMLRVLRKAIATKRPCVQLALHSSNLMPYGSPTFPEPHDVEALYQGLHTLFSAASRQFRGATVSEFRREFREGAAAYAA